MNYDYKAMASMRPPKRMDAPIQTIQRYLLPEEPEFSEADLWLFATIDEFRTNRYVNITYEDGEEYPTISGLAKVVMMREGSTRFVISTFSAKVLGLPCNTLGEELEFIHKGTSIKYTIKKRMVRRKMLRVYYTDPRSA